MEINSLVSSDVTISQGHTPVVKALHMSGYRSVMAPVWLFSTSAYSPSAL